MRGIDLVLLLGELERLATVALRFVVVEMALDGAGDRVDVERVLIAFARQVE